MMWLLIAFRSLANALERSRKAPLFNLNVSTQAHAPCHVSVTGLRQQSSPCWSETLVEGLARFDDRGRGEIALVFEGFFARVRNGGDRSADATTEHLRPAMTRPIIGLALGGGAARGFAHIGVMR